MSAATFQWGPFQYQANLRPHYGWGEALDIRLSQLKAQLDVLSVISAYGHIEELGTETTHLLIWSMQALAEECQAIGKRASKPREAVVA